jgi:hypothetical protein
MPRVAHELAPIRGCRSARRQYQCPQQGWRDNGSSQHAFNPRQYGVSGPYRNETLGAERLQQTRDTATLLYPNYVQIM